MRHFLLALGALVAALFLQMPAIAQSQPGSSGQPGEGSNNTQTGNSSGSLDGADGSSSEVSGGAEKTNGTSQKASSSIGIDEEIQVDTAGGTGQKTTTSTSSTGTTSRRGTGASSTSSRSRTSGALAASSDIPVIILMPNTAVAGTSAAGTAEVAGDTAFSNVEEEQAETVSPEKSREATRSDTTKPTATRSVARFAGILIVIAAGYLLLRQPKTR